ncbi:MAG: DnaJ domain-containing protein [Magnetococcales bacterium]|nr:DnaJ domain-containing protein [Magnetococcales bacterium]
MWTEDDNVFLLDETKRLLLDRLMTILSHHPEGLKEHALVQILRKEGIPLFTQGNLSDPLQLFQIHFLLFHILYLLRDHLMEQGKGDVEIHCLMIRIKPASRPCAEGVALMDPLRDYYLDLEHLEKTTREDVVGMIASFWRMLERDQQRHAALQTLGLPGNADRSAIKNRYRQLAKMHHPDAGGNGVLFAKVAAAVAILLKA